MISWPRNRFRKGQPPEWLSHLTFMGRTFTLYPPEIEPERETGTGHTASNCLEQQSQPAFAANHPEEYSVQYPGWKSARGGSVPFGGQMWSSKKPETPQSAQPELKNLPTNQPPKPGPATWEGTTAMSTDAMRPLGATADRATARLGSSLHVKGEISGNEDLTIDGSVEGLIQLDERKLTVGTAAKVTADIVAREVVVLGSVKDRIEIRKDGSVNGDLTTARIMIEDGAYFKGSIEIDKSAEKESGHSVFAKTSPAPGSTMAATKTI